MARETVDNNIIALMVSFLIYSFLIRSSVSARTVVENNDENQIFVFEGDISGYDRQAVQSIDQDLAKNGVMDESLRWSDRIVPFVLSEIYETHARRVIFDAIEGFSGTCLKFVQRRDEEDYIRIAPGIGCQSPIGKIGGQQTIVISNSAACLKKGIIQHEIMHSIGFYHEQARLDRDNYVDINTDNIKEADKIQFKKYLSNDFHQPYDFGSVMHYGGTDFAKDKNIWTIRPKTPYSDRRIGQRDALSKTDIDKINLMYKCADQLKQVAVEQTTELPTPSEVELSSTRPSTRQLTEIFRDDFNDQSIDNEIWSINNSNSSAGVQYFASDDVWEESGYILIQSRRRKLGGRKFTSGDVTTKDKFKFLYGEVEWRAKLPEGQGIGSYLIIAVPNGASINIAARGDIKDVLAPTLFYKSQLGTSARSFQKIYGPDDTVGSFHKFKVIWERDRIMWLVDGRIVWSITDSEKIPQEEGWLQMNLVVGGKWTGAPDSTTPFPTCMMIDYVTVHQWT